MATVEVWIQLENHAWDVCPSLPRNRMESAGTTPVGPLKTALLRSPVTGHERTAVMHDPLPGEALLLRRYTKDWGAPDDRKVNPWDLNELDPTDSGTMGTIPGATIELAVGDTVHVHFRNLDTRTEPAPPWVRAPALPAARRTHSLHAHGVTFANTFDGAYPLSPPDREQPIGATERALWTGIGVTGPFKQGDRVPPGASFTYTWKAAGPASAGVWVYHDHSIADMESTGRGAVGMIVVRNPADTAGEVDITPARLPGGSWTGSPLIRHDVPLGGDRIKLSASALEHLHPGPQHDPPKLVFGELELKLDRELSYLEAISIGRYRDPPDQARYLLLFHELEGGAMAINGRQFLGNAPTVVAGPATRMRFGVAGLGDNFHTFHIHGHRWVVPGPSGKTRTAIEQSAQTEPTTPFEDAKVFGPGSSFAFTLEEGQGLFRADPPVGEWHMHCHVAMHMMHGMAGSLLVIRGGEFAFQLPEGQPAPLPPEPAAPPRPPKTFDVEATDTEFKPVRVYILPGDTVRWTNTTRTYHSATANDGSWHTGLIPFDGTQSHTFTTLGTWEYHCDYEGPHHHHNQFDIITPAVVVMDHEFGITGSDGDPVTTPSPPAPTGATPAPAPAAATHDVSITASGFSPSSITIKAGDSLRWTNTDTTPHTATGDDHAWTSPTLPGGTTFSRTFPAKGTVPYHCHIHHEMTATVIVT